MKEYTLPLTIKKNGVDISGTIKVEAIDLEDAETLAKMELDEVMKNFDYGWFNNGVRGLKALAVHMKNLFIKTVGR